MFVQSGDIIIEIDLYIYILITQTYDLYEHLRKKISLNKPQSSSSLYIQIRKVI